MRSAFESHGEDPTKNQSKRKECTLPGMPYYKGNSIIRGGGGAPFNTSLKQKIFCKFKHLQVASPMKCGNDGCANKIKGHYH